MNRIDVFASYYRSNKPQQGNTGQVFLVQHEAAKQTKELFQMAKDTMSPEEYKRFCFENGVTP